MSGGKKKVVIIGAGYGGIEAAKALDSKFEVTVVERKKSFFHCVASVRLAVEPELVSDLYIPYDKVLKNGKFIYSTATEITPDHITLENGTTLEFDYLVIATGSNVLAPFKSPTDIDSNNSQLEQYFNNYSNQIKQAKSILIVGGGSVGIELVGEIKDKYKDKSITVVHSGSALVNDQMADKFNQLTLKAMDKRNVRVIFNDRVQLPHDIKESLKHQNALLPKLEQATYTTEKGEKIDADLVIYTVGIKINNESFTNSHFEQSINQQGQIMVNSSFQVQGFNNIFAIGDITDTKELKSAFNASTHGKFLSKVLDSLLKNKPLPVYTPSKPVMILSLGKNDGVFQLPNQMVFGSWLSKTLKSKTFFIKKTWDNFNNPLKLTF